MPTPTRHHVGPHLPSQTIFYGTGLIYKILALPPFQALQKYSPRSQKPSNPDRKQRKKRRELKQPHGRRRSPSPEAVLVQEALAVVPPPQRQPERPAPPPRVRPLRPQRRRRDHPGRDGVGPGHARPGRRPPQPGGHRGRLHPGRRRGARIRGLREPPPRPRRRALRPHRRGGGAPEGGRRRGHEGGVPGVRRERRRVHLGRRVAGRAQEARPGGGAEPCGGAGDDLQRRPRPRRPGRLRRVQGHDAGDHRVGSLTTAPGLAFAPLLCLIF